MGKRILWRMPDGKIAVTTPCAPVLENESEEEYLDRIAQKLIDDGVATAWTRLPNCQCTEIPEDREYRNSWDHDGQKIIHNMGVAREIHMTNIRSQRNAQLEKIDVEVRKAYGDGERIAQLEAEAQRLRDIPQTIRPQLNAATTIEELREVKPL